ncbi:surfeit locus 1 family protein [Aurantimicrobium minutum]|uniref:SURF1 family protein n=1 Tax=Aurantimicrobium minutum TaxID=708131 RepID=UPI002476335B|nr:SURF1 family cytochrome oxidase biogenesis protein [Aurantimicrobium minutum]MDH6277644.1 surfeit locus 1 family protein [Aurantimicrobium minutum]
MLRTALKVRWIAFLLLVMGAAAAFAWLGQWQLERAIIASQPVDAESETIIPLVELQEPGIAPSEIASGHMTEVTGYLYPDSYTVLTGRLNYGEAGYWLVGRFLTEEGSLPIALGWAADEATVLAVQDELNAAPSSEPAVVTGRFMPTEAPVVPEGEQGPFVESTLSVASLVNLWPDFAGPVYEGYLVADDAPAGLDVIESIPPMNEGSVNWLNIFYAVEWVVFAGFAFFIWWRLVKDAYERELEEKALLEAK